MNFSDIEVSSKSEVSSVSDVEMPQTSPMSMSEHSPQEQRNSSPIEGNKQCPKKRKKQIRKKKQRKSQIIMTEYNSENEPIADSISLQKIKDRHCQSVESQFTKMKRKRKILSESQLKRCTVKGQKGSSSLLGTKGP